MAESADVIFAVFIGIVALASVGLYLFFAKYRRRATGRPRWLTVVAGNFLVLFFLVSILVVLGETYFRFGRDTTDTFMLSIASRRWYERHYHLNNIGVRDDVNYSLPLTPGKRRI